MDDAAGKVYVGIPAYNEQENIGVVLDEWTSHPDVHKVIVVDDGSTDRTREVVARRPSVLLHCHSVNKGVGAAQLSLMRAFLGASDHDQDIFMLVHADGAMEISEIQQFVSGFREQGPDVILGSRLLRWRQNLRHRSWARTYLDMALILLENLAFRTWLTSYGSGFRAWKRSAIERLCLNEVISLNYS